jgi:hypothetical protein
LRRRNDVIRREDHSDAEAEGVAPVASADAQISCAHPRGKCVAQSEVHAAISIEREVGVGYGLIDGGDVVPATVTRPFT